MARSAPLRTSLRLANNLSGPVRRHPVAAVAGYPRFVAAWLRYRRLGGTAPVRALRPQLTDATAVHQVDHHYLQLGAWAMRQLAAARPVTHVDVGGHALFVAMAAAITDVEFVDIRPLGARVTKVTDNAGSILELPYGDGAVGSISCLHVAEHIGLGRYGDPLDPDGTTKAARELARVVAPGGVLYFALPIGAARTEFNAHRVHDVAAVLALFPELELEQFAVVDDDGTFHEPAPVEGWESRQYACGLFRFRRAG